MSSVSSQFIGDIYPENSVPKTIFYGLLSNMSSSGIERVDIIDGLCFNYNPLFHRCSYYRDCCAPVPTKYKEQLPSDTYSCHNGMYVVDRCPHGTSDAYIKEKCEGLVKTFGG